MNLKEKRARDIFRVVSSYIRQDRSLSLISISKVEMSDDLSLAKIYWDSFASDEKQSFVPILQKLAPAIRQQLAAELQLKHTPQIKLICDLQFEASSYIDKLLKE